ncbi:hypothetical protein [Rhizobium rhizogenes]|nr:hypothetical protein [Rhizobium rhizogenes]
MSLFKWFDELIPRQQKARLELELVGAAEIAKIQALFEPLG